MFFTEAINIKQIIQNCPEIWTLQVILGIGTLSIKTLISVQASACMTALEKRISGYYKETMWIMSKTNLGIKNRFSS